MLTSISRAAARRMTSPSAQLVSRHVPAVACPATTARAFTVSAWDRLPASKATLKAAPKAAAKKAITTKKAAPKKTATKATTKTTTKTATKVKAETAKAEPVPKKRVKKVLTPEEQEKLELRELKKWALLTKNPALPESAWTVFTSQGMKTGEQDLPSRMKELSEKFKNLSAYERDPLEATAASNRVTNEANYKDWVHSHPVERIYLANKARRRLARKTGKAIRVIRDDRLPKAPGSPYSAFVKARYSAADSGQSLAETMKVLSEEWKSLDAAEKSSYESQASAGNTTYSAKLDKIKEKAKELQLKVKAEEEAAAQAKAQARAEARRKARAE